MDVFEGAMEIERSEGERNREGRPEGRRRGGFGEWEAGSGAGSCFFRLEGKERGRSEGTDNEQKIWGRKGKNGS
jgi:hypothetical protein